jgi:hypothetical protein
MKDYSVLKSSRETLLKMAGYDIGHRLFQTKTPNQAHEFREATVQGDSDSNSDQN